MGDDKHGFVPDQLLQRQLHLMFVFRVGIGRGLVQHQNRRIFEDRPCHGDPLLLTAGKIHAAFSDQRIVTIRQLLDKLVTLGGFGRGIDLFLGCPRLSGGKIVVERIGKQEGILKNKGHTVHQILRFHLPHIHAADADTARTHIPEPWNQLGNGGFAAAGGADDGCDLPLLGAEINIFQHLWGIFPISEGHMVKDKIIMLRFFSALRFANLRFRHDPVNAVHRLGDAGHALADIGQLENRGGDARCKDQEKQQRDGEGHVLRIAGK